jgi:hypothetical protein
MSLTNAVYETQTNYDYPAIGEAVKLLKELILQRRKNPCDRSRSKHNQII